MSPLADGRASGVGHGDGPPVLPTTPAPQRVTDLAAGRKVTAVWANQIGQVTWRLGELGDCDYVKYGSPHREFDPVVESAKLSFAAAFVPAPRVIEFGEGHDDEGHEVVWLVTAGLPGRSAVDAQLSVPPAQLVAELGLALRRFHDRLPVADCRFSRSIADRLRDAPRPELVTDLAGQAPAEDDLVVNHGDSCNPNFLIDDRGRCSGYVDLGNLGVADRWADLQPALLSLSWNFPDIDRQVFLDSYGIDFNASKYDFYCRLWNNGG